MILLVCESRKLRDSQATQYIAFFPSCETRETRETRIDIFARSESQIPQYSREKNCERDSLSTLLAMRLSVSYTFAYMPAGLLIFLPALLFHCLPACVFTCLPVLLPVFKPLNLLKYHKILYKHTCRLAK
jgi:hypothetical protein